MLTGKIITTNKNLESHDIPDRFYKRMDVWIFKHIWSNEDFIIRKQGAPMWYASKLCSCHDEFYYCGDCDDDVMPYFIPVEWVKLDKS